MPDPTYASDANVYTLADAVAQNADVKGKVWSRMLEVGANTIDDFTFLEGPPESKKPFWKKTELAADGGDTVIFSTIGDVGGPGVRGEKELTGNTSKPRMGAYSCKVDYWRDAVELTKKQLKFLAAGKSLETVLLGMLSRKLGRQKMYDMMMSLIRKGTTVLRPNGRTATADIRASDTLTPSFLVDAKARLQGQGARPVDMSKSKSGSPVMHYLAFLGQDAMVDIRNSTSYQNALLQAQTRGDDNPLFSGKLVDWQGIYIWEHIVVDPDADDAIGSPIAPKALLGVAITAANTVFTMHADDGTNAKPLYFGFFDGYDWLWTEDQTPTVDGNVYYFWVVNTSGADAGKAGFYSYTGSTGNTGNTILIVQRLRAGANTAAVTTLGQVVWDGATMTDAHPVGSWIIPANQWGVPIARNFMFGAGAALRAYGSVQAEPIRQERDYKFVAGMGYESIFGQIPTYDTKNKTRNFVILETAFEHPGITVPFVAE